jgi:ABC-2 type transport system permease protein
MSLDFAPAPGAAPSHRRIIRQASFELKTTLRNGEQLLLTLIIPLALLIGLSLSSIVDLGGSDRVAIVVPGILTLAVMSAAFTSLAVATGFERRYGSLTLLGTTPLTRTQILAAKGLAVAAVEIIQFVLIIGVGLMLGWAPTGIGWAIVLIVLGTAAFASLGLLLAGVLRAEATLAIANGIYLILLLAGGTIVAADRLPGGMASGVQILPSAALGTGLREAMLQGTFAWLPALILLIWAAVGGGLAAKFFKWQ